LGAFQGIWDFWWHLLLNILVAINSVVGIPGVAIIVFTIFIRLLTVPLNMKALRSSRNMQQIQPLVKEVQAKYPKDRAKQQEETMKIYQQHGVNPAAGCFPMLVQLPIFFGLYSALRFVLDHGSDPLIMSSVLFNSAWVGHAADFSGPFLWVPNLAKPDPYYIWPVLSAMFQFVQSRMSIPNRDPSQKLDSQTQMMQNMMQFMPIIILFTSINFPAGTVIYWAVSSIFGAVQQYFITGFGALPNVPGLGWLPRKAAWTPPPPPALPAGGAPLKKGMFAKMMDKALEAQGAQKSALDAQASTETSTTTDGASTVRVKGKGKGNDHPIKSVPTTTMKYASDLKYRDNNHSENGVEHITATSTPAQLPRKKRNKK